MWAIDSSQILSISCCFTSSERTLVFQQTVGGRLIGNHRLPNRSIPIFAKSILFGFILSLLFYHVANACSPAEHGIFVKCNPAERYGTHVNEYLQINDGESIEDAKKRQLAVTYQNIFNLACRDELAPISASIREHADAWLNSNHRYFLDGNLIIEPYSLKRANQLSRSSLNILTCRYENIEQVGSWLYIAETSRDYCNVQRFLYLGGLCPSVVFSFVQFALYLLLNPSVINFAYLAGSIGVLIIAIRLWNRLRNKYLSAQYKLVLSIGLVILFPFGVFFLLFPESLIGQITGIATITYFISQRKHILRPNAT